MVARHGAVRLLPVGVRPTNLGRTAPPHSDVDDDGGPFAESDVMSRDAMAFGVSVAYALVAWTIVARLYIWPALRGRPPRDALRPLLVLHTFRFVGLSFLVPGVVSPALPVAFGRPAAYGDRTTATLALLTIALLRRGLGTPLAWVTNVLGTIDLLYAFYQGGRIGFPPGLQGAAYFIPSVLVPLLLVTHALAFIILLRP